MSNSQAGIPAPVLITGVTGQDGSYLAEILLKRGDRVVGLTRDETLSFGPNIEHLKGRLELEYCSYDESSILSTVERFRPRQIYNLAGQTYVAKSWDLVTETIEHSALIPVHFLNAIIRIDRKIQFFQSSSSEIFRSSIGTPLNEESSILPSNPYGCAKAFAHHMVRSYRQHYGLFAVNGIFFNHESSRRHVNFLSRKVVSAAVRIKLGLANELSLGNLSAVRDWGYAPEYVDAAVRMLDLDRPIDLILATGEGNSVEGMVEAIFSRLDLDWKKYVKIDPKLSRSYEVESIVGNPALATDVLGWSAQTRMNGFLDIMIEHELTQQKNLSASKGTR